MEKGTCFRFYSDPWINPVKQDLNQFDSVSEAVRDEVKLGVD